MRTYLRAYIPTYIPAYLHTYKQNPTNPTNPNPYNLQPLPYLTVPYPTNHTLLYTYILPTHVQ